MLSVVDGCATYLKRGFAAMPNKPRANNLRAKAPAARSGAQGWRPGGLFPSTTLARPNSRRGPLVVKWPPPLRADALARLQVRSSKRALLVTGPRPREGVSSTLLKSPSNWTAAYTRKRNTPPWQIGLPRPPPVKIVRGGSTSASSCSGRLECVVCVKGSKRQPARPCSFRRLASAREACGLGIKRPPAVRPGPQTAARRHRTLTRLPARPLSRASTHQPRRYFRLALRAPYVEDSTPPGRLVPFGGGGRSAVSACSAVILPSAQHVED